MSAGPVTKRGSGRSVPRTIPRLENGDRLTAKEFERRYDAMPDLKKAELIEGVVYVGSPVSDEHGIPHFDVIGWLAMYRMATPGVLGADNTTVRLGRRNRPQPDVYLRIKPEYGGQARLSADRHYVVARRNWSSRWLPAAPAMTSTTSSAPMPVMVSSSTSSGASRMTRSTGCACATASMCRSCPGRMGSCGARFSPASGSMRRP